jgi:hypothetical protein
MFANIKEVSSHIFLFIARRHVILSMERRRSSLDLPRVIFPSVEDWFESYLDLKEVKTGCVRLCQGEV